MNRIEMDDRVSLAQQASSREAPAVLVTILRSAPEHSDALVAAWAADATVLKRKRGFISTQLLRGIAGSCTLLNYTLWESVDAYRHASADPSLQIGAARYPDSTVSSPHLFEPVAVPGICVGVDVSPWTGTADTQSTPTSAMS